MTKLVDSPKQEKAVADLSGASLSTGPNIDRFAAKVEAWVAGHGKITSAFDSPGHLNDRR